MQKIKSIRDRLHLAFVRKLPCCVCGMMPSQAAHIRIGMFGGMGMKPGDDCAVPLCAKCHMESHNVGEIKFWSGAIGSAKYLAKMLYAHSGNAFSGLKYIQIYRNDANL